MGRYRGLAGGDDRAENGQYERTGRGYGRVDTMAADLRSGEVSATMMMRSEGCHLNKSVFDIDTDGHDAHLRDRR